MLTWRNLIGPNDPRYTVKGNELNVALCGPNSRFALYEVRCLEPAGEGSPNRYELGLRYRVRDAGQVSDAMLKEGTRPPVAFEGDYEAAINFIKSQNNC